MSRRKSKRSKKTCQIGRQSCGEAGKSPNCTRKTTSGLYNVTTNNGNVFDTLDSNWYEVTPGDITDAKNWKRCD